MIQNEHKIQKVIDTAMGWPFGKDVRWKNTSNHNQIGGGSDSETYRKIGERLRGRILEQKGKVCEHFRPKLFPFLEST